MTSLRNVHKRICRQNLLRKGYMEREALSTAVAIKRHKYKTNAVRV